MTAIGQHLAVELLAEGLHVGIDNGLLIGDAKPRIDECHECNEARHAVGSIAIAGGQIAELLGEGAQEGLVGARLARIEHHDGVREPGNGPAGDDLRLEGETAHSTVEPDEVPDQHLRLLAGELAASGAKMAKPAKAIQLPRPGLRRRLDLER